MKGYLFRIPRRRHLLLLAFGVGLTRLATGAEPAGSQITIHPEKTKQVIRGLGFEIQSDSVGSGNQGLPDHAISVPHDLVPSERQRLYTEMLKGFRYCRLAGGLYWRGLDADQKCLRPRWPEQLAELREMREASGLEGLSFEYWSPAPFWKANRCYVSSGIKDTTNTLRCFGPDFAKDPVYHGDTDRFLADFASAVVSDIQTLRDAGLPVSMWGLQNEPWFSHGPGFSTCGYPTAASYVKAYRAVASAIRNYDKNILLFADTERDFPRQIATGMNDPEVARLVDAYAVHTIGSPSEHVRTVHQKIRAELPPRPWFQNEYEYLRGGATPARCLNTVQHIMNSFQLAENPTWFWIHALKPLSNAEASGYSLGFWKPSTETTSTAIDDKRHRWSEGPELTSLPEEFDRCEMISATRGDSTKPGAAYDFTVNQPVVVYLLVEKAGNYSPGTAWQITDHFLSWEGGQDTIYRRSFPAGKISIPAHTGKQGDRFGAPHLVFVQPSDASTFAAEIGANVPIQIRSEFLKLAQAAVGLQPGHWMFNRYNWNAVGSFVKHMPWDCVAVDVSEATYNPDARILAFKRPNGKLTVVVSNRTPTERGFTIATGRPQAVWRGFRYTPEEAGANTLGIPLREKTGESLQLKLPHLSWEFWEEQ